MGTSPSSYIQVPPPPPPGVYSALDTYKCFDTLKDIFVGSMEAPSKVFLLFFLFSDWLKSKHLSSRIERGFLDIFSRHICSAVTETIRVTNYATSFGAKECSEN